MNFLRFILGRADLPQPVSTSSSGNFSDLLSLCNKHGAVVIYGSGLEISRFYKKIKSKIKMLDTVFLKKFAILSGSMDRVDTALPLDSRKVLNSALNSLNLVKRTGLRKKFAIAVLKIFDFSFLYPLIFRNQFCILVNSQRETLFSFLSRGLDVPAAGMSASFYRSSRKVIMPLFNSETGKNIAYVKIYASKEKSRYYGENENRAIHFLEEFSFKSAEPPSILMSRYFGDYFVMALSSKKNLKNYKKSGKAHIDWIKELVDKTGKRKIFKDSFFAHEMEREINLIKNRVDEENTELVEYFYKQARRALWEKEFIFSFVNREFAYWELLRHKDKNLVIDWEHARNDFPPIFDVYSLLMNDWPCEYKDYVKTYTCSLETLFFIRNKRVNNILEKLFNEWEISKEEAYSFFLLFLVDQLYICLHVNHKRSAERVITFLSKIYKDENHFRDKWLSY